MSFEVILKAYVSKYLQLNGRSGKTEIKNNMKQ